ncbi:MAG TPA: polysaccharide biosynthesis/export family protein, partial [Candidatus Kapabacteria bacterium]|nr:polysaccharide biosynthesis/export family protein [Candidatus Kapabacteria bacterium]
VLQFGCATPEGAQTAMDTSPSATAPLDPALTSTEYRAGDKVYIDFADNVGMPSNWQQTVREDGTITLPLGQQLRAAGLRKGELESAIHDLYVPRILKRLTVNVRKENQSYFVNGEVKNSGQKDHTGLITVMKAISAAGDFSDYANKSKIDVIRANGERLRVNGKKIMNGEETDLPIYPGDRVYVYRRYW